MTRRHPRGEPELPGLELQPSLSQLLTAESVGIDPRAYDDITDFRIAEPSQIRSSLIGVDWKEGRSVLTHQMPRGSRYIGVAVNPEDYDNIARSAEHLGKAVINKTLKTYPVEERYLPEKEAAAERSGVHAVEGKLTQIDDRLGKIHHQRNLLESLSEMSKGKNFNLRRSYEARDRFHELMNDVVADMVNAVGIQRRYNQDDMDLMKRTIEKRLYIWPENVGPRVKYFGWLTELGAEYYGHLVMIFASKRYEANRYIREHSEQ